MSHQPPPPDRVLPRPRRDRRASTAASPAAQPSDRGAVTLELVVLFPLLLLLIFGVLQGALFLHGRNVVQAAAEQGVRAGRVDGQSAASTVAVAQARQFLADSGELDNLTEVSVTPTVSGDQLRLTVTGRTVSLLPGVPGPQVSRSAAGSLERFTSRTAP